MNVEKINQDSLDILLSDGSTKYTIAPEDLLKAKSICIDFEKKLEEEGVPKKSTCIIFTRFVAELLKEIDEPDFTKVLAYSLIRGG